MGVLRHRAPIALAALVGATGAAALAVAATRDESAISRGADVAQGRCANCHAVALEDHSPEKYAPQFRVLSRLYSAQTLSDELLDISENGHFEMPPVTLRQDEIADVAAYIASLDGGSVDLPQRRGDPVATVDGRPRTAKATP